MFKKAVSITIVAVILSFKIALASFAQGGKGFPDVKGHWAEDTVQWAIDKKVVSGYPDGTFKPNNNISEAEFLAMLIRSYKPDITASKQGHWAESYYEFAAKMNYPLAGGADVGVRGKVISRLRVAELISASQGVNFNGNDAIRYLYANKLSSGSDPNKLTITSFNAGGTLTRAEAVQFIKNLFDGGKGDLQVRPQEPTETTNLPDIPSGDEKTTPTMTTGELDLSFKTPDGWRPPLIQSTVTWDPVKDAEILKNELGLADGMYYDSQGSTLPSSAQIMVSESKGNAIIVFYGWYGSKTDVDTSNTVPYIGREIFRFYMPESYKTLFKIMDDGYGPQGKNISKYVNKPFKLQDQEVEIMRTPTTVQVYISQKGKKLDLN